MKFFKPEEKSIFENDYKILMNHKFDSGNWCITELLIDSQKSTIIAWTSIEYEGLAYVVSCKIDTIIGIYLDIEQPVNVNIATIHLCDIDFDLWTIDGMFKYLEKIAETTIKSYKLGITKG